MEQLLSNISWAQFLAATMLILAIYYSYLAYHYYPREIRSLFQKKYQPGHNPFSFKQEQEETDASLPQAVATPAVQHLPFEETTDDTFDRIEELVERIKPVLAGFDQAEDHSLLLTVLKPILSDFPELKHSPFSPAIIELIQTEIKHTGSASPSEQEIRAAWE
ncbi:MAG: hypothetical protein V4594_20015 [Bacteroidota bacterium]